MRILYKIILKLSVVMCLISLVFFTVSIRNVHGDDVDVDDVGEVEGVPFGGLDVFEFPCTCTAGELFWHVFAPLYLNNPVPIIGALAAEFTALEYPYYFIEMGSWALGEFEPGAGSACYVGVTPYCYPLPNYGLILSETGTSGTF